ncbi:uncharacterized protein TNCV_4362511 [Trichonephila clavipes]|nr:uncharacterized protein TNCV_4362511 [Trichonephila clavipes]
MLLSITLITSGKHSGERWHQSGQPIRRLRKTCKKAVPGTIQFSFGRDDTSIDTESVLNVHFIIYALVFEKHWHRGIQVLYDVLRHFVVTLSLVRSNSWDAKLVIPNDPTYALLETNLRIGQEKKGQ